MVVVPFGRSKKRKIAYNKPRVETICNLYSFFKANPGASWTSEIRKHVKVSTVTLLLLAYQNYLTVHPRFFTRVINGEKGCGQTFVWKPNLTRFEQFFIDAAIDAKRIKKKTEERREETKMVDMLQNQANYEAEVSDDD